MENNMKGRVSISSVILDEVNANNLDTTPPATECLGIDGIVVTPTHMEFKDGAEGLTIDQTLTLQNLGNKVAIVKINKPNSMSFKIKPTPKNGYRLCPGLCLTKIVSYSYKVPASNHAMIPIEINGITFDYDLICKTSQPQIVVKPIVLDFGCVDVGSVSDIKKLHVNNDGKKSARFIVDLGHDMTDINIQPLKGIVKPESSEILYAQVTGLREGVYHKELWIKSHPNVHITINFKVIQPKLIVNCPVSNNGFSLIDFPMTFLGTKNIVSFTLKNVSSQITIFVMFSDDNGNLESIKELNTKNNPTFDAFRIQPLEGALQPFEEKVFTIIFRPTIKALKLFQKDMKNKDVDYFTAAVKICKLNINEAKDIIKIESSIDIDKEKRLSKLFIDDFLIEENNSTDPSFEENIKTETTIYLHGKVEIPQLNFTPKDLNLGDLNISDRIQRKIQVENLSRQLPLTLTFVSKPCVRCEPHKVFLKSTEVVEFIITIKAEYNLEASFKLEFDVSAESTDEHDLKKKKSLNIAKFFLPCHYNPIKASGKINVGNICKLSSMNKLPLEPDYSLTYTNSETKLRINHREYWTHYFREIFSKKCENISVDEDSLGVDNFNEFCSSVDIPQFRDVSFAHKALEKFLNSRHENARKDKFLKTLTPTQIFKIRVFPLKLDFGKIALKTCTQRQLTFENRNDFPVVVFLMSLQPQYVSFPKRDQILLPPDTIVTCPIQFRPQHYGKFTSYINYIINACHKYQLPFVINTLPKYIDLLTVEIIFEKNYHQQEAYRLPFQIIELENKLNISTKYKWKLPPNSNFEIEPAVGDVPGHQKLYLAVYQKFDPFKMNRAESTLYVEDGGQHNLRLESTVRSLNVYLANENLDVGEIPLNLERRIKTVLCNAEYQPVGFEIAKESLVKGIRVWPTCGIVPPRGLIVLNVYLKFDACIDFWTSINIIVQKKLSLQLRIHCVVLFPKLKFTPTFIEMKRVSSNSHQVHGISISNLTKCEIEVKFLLDEYPEFYMSRSEFKKDMRVDTIEIPGQTTVKSYLHFVPYDLASYSFYLPVMVNQLIESSTADDKDLRIDEFLSKNADFYSEFAAVTILPCPMKFPSIHIVSTVVRSAISFNKLFFTFNNENLQDEFRISNISKKQLTFILIIKDLISASKLPFTITYKNDKKNRKTIPIVTDDMISCELLPEQIVFFEIKFEAKTVGRSIVELPIILKDDKEVPFNNLILKGLSFTNEIKCDVMELYLVPIPLNVTSKEHFNLKVDNFTKSSFVNTKIHKPKKYSGTFSTDTVKINFPNGNAIKANCSHEILVEIQFKSSILVSFCSQIVFSDAESETSASVLIYAAADDCTLTTYIYEKTETDNFLLTKEFNCSRELMSTLICKKDNVKKSCELKSIISSSNISTIAKYNSNKIEKIHDTDHHKTVGAPKKETFSDLDITIISSCESSRSSRSIYPFFPSDDSLEHKKSYMTKTLKSVEEWLYSYAMRYQFNPTLTDGMTIALSGLSVKNVPSSTDKKKNGFDLHTFIDILEYLTDSVEVHDINSRLKELDHKNDEERIYLTIKVYQDVVDYLLSKGACIAYISPEFLLDYDDYVTEKKNSSNNLTSECNYVLAEEIHQSRSKQSWLDLILQSYKCFVLKQVNELAQKEHVMAFESSKNFDSKLYSYQPNTDKIIGKSKEKANRSKNEVILLEWLESCHKKIFTTRVINNFEDCLNDALVFIAVTMTYCPYLKNKFFTNICLNPTNLNEKTHNIICLIQAWKKIHLGFIVIPSDILNANCTQMLMLTVHLYTNLPTYLIKNKIGFSCPLTQSITQPIKLSISTKCSINYIIELIGNDIDLFNSKSIVTIHPRKNKQIKVTYHARKILHVKVYLLLCGSAIGPNFGENQVFILEGCPSELEISDTHVIRSKLYQIVDKTLNIFVPYNYETEYEIWLSYEQPKNPDNLKMTRWDDLKLHKVVQCLIINSKSLLINEENYQTANIGVTVVCITCEQKSFWLIFKSNIADFVIQINLVCKSSITDYDFIELTEETCICSDLPKQVVDECPLVKKFGIHSKNKQLQSCLLRAFQKSLSQDETIFWTQHLNNCIGLHLINYMMKEVDEQNLKGIKHAFYRKVTYSLTFNKKSDILVYPKSVTIQDVQDYDHNIEFKLHDIKINPERKNALITLTSLDKKEIRVCQVNFFYNIENLGK